MQILIEERIGPIWREHRYYINISWHLYEESTISSFRKYEVFVKRVYDVNEENQHKDIFLHGEILRQKEHEYTWKKQETYLKRAWDQH